MGHAVTLRNRGADNRPVGLGARSAWEARVRAAWWRGGGCARPGAAGGAGGGGRALVHSGERDGAQMHFEDQCLVGSASP